MDIVVSVLAFIVAGALVLGVMIYRAQKNLDAPYGGILVVEKSDGEPTAVYLQAAVDPTAFTDGQELKLKVRVLEDSQGKQRS